MLDIGVVAIPDPKPMSLPALAVLRTASTVAGSPADNLRLISEAGGLVPIQAGSALAPEPRGEAAVRPGRPGGGRARARGHVRNRRVYDVCDMARLP
ncbi:hypothetical protein J2X36_004462 [Methylobacterium sp. BE186]|uniref:hypothetical protein n=1 Tax=Methylobacterium sp. BE186 TaxID=2817715 RepID=UPI00285D58D2|nr:hypothetical protein [Methylobacterium sp. BE186]MDR7039685.1 hypothetical protein [Methylobacterium sp. BE186]